MTVTTIPLDQIVCVLRRPFELLQNAEGVPLPDRRTGEPVYVAEAVLPGMVPGRFTTDDRASAVRLKLTGAQPPELPAGSVVRLIGGKLTTWYVARARGVDARSAATISVERVEAAPGERPAVRGGLPAHTNGVGTMFLGQTQQGSGDSAYFATDVMFDADGVFAVEGVAEVRCKLAAADDLIAQPVRLVGLRAYFIVPDSADVSQRTKAELLLACSAIERIEVASNGRQKRAEPEPAAAEG